MTAQLKTDLLKLIEERRDTDRGLVEFAKDEIAQALNNGITIGEVYKVLRDNGFKGSRALFTRILVEKGVYAVKSRAGKGGNMADARG